jgi:hypothetical protein
MTSASISRRCEPVHVSETTTMNRCTTALLSLALTACAGAPPSSSPVEPAAPSVTPTADAPTMTAPTMAAPTRLSRRMHAHAMTEVVLDAHGRGALTLDERGGLRLWPDVQAEGVALPIALPEQEPSWMSIGRSDDTNFVVATLDTTGTARVSRITIDGRGASRVALFELPAVDPQFEIHVLDGGARILALGKDHRVRLFDTDGRVLSQIDERGFIPWQLRVVETPGKPVALAAVLTQPVRAQALVLDGDTLRVVGEGRMVALDQSPNRNDLSLSPDGTTIAALRRTSARKREFALQLITLATGERRVIMGNVDEKARPRLHYVDDDRVLLESGSGKGFWIDLEQALPRDAPSFPPAVMRAVALPGGEGDLRMQVTLAAGVRVIAAGSLLTVDPVATADHRALRRMPFEATAITLDATGTKVAWSNDKSVWIEDLTDDEDTAPDPFEAATPVRSLAFDDDGHLRVVTAGAVVSTVEAPRAAPRVAVDTRGLRLRGRELRAAVSAPAGSLLAVALAHDTLARSDRQPILGTLEMFDAATQARLWTAPLGNAGLLAWSGDGQRIASLDGEALRITDARTGAPVHTRSDVGLVVVPGKD